MARQSKKAQIYAFICKHLDEKGFAPTVRDICSAVGLSSPASVQAHLKSLEQEGQILRDGKHHGYKVVGIHPSYTAQKDVPLIGHVAAGLPITAIENIEDRFPLPKILLSGSVDESFMLHVRGDSMIDAGIFDGDVIVVSCQGVYYDGDIVVARIDNEEYTVKRIYYHKAQIELRAANSNYPPMFFSSDRVEIAGKVSGLMRSL